MKVSLKHTQQDRSDVQQELALENKIDINHNALFFQKQQCLLYLKKKSGVTNISLMLSSLVDQQINTTNMEKKIWEKGFSWFQKNVYYLYAFN